MQRVCFVMPYIFSWKEISKDVKNNVDCSFMIFTRRSTHTFALLSAILVSKHTVCCMKLYNFISYNMQERARAYKIISKTSYFQ